MTPQEFDQLLDDLEIRLERLRSLYEQYFMGMERLEPTIARKDVDRRFWLLRREKVRNTARRFKLQTLTQRYNTLQQYWQRTCREIEHGTYRRHKLRAERTIGSIDAAAQAAQPAHQSSLPPEAETAIRAKSAVRTAEEDLRDLLSSDFDPAAEIEAALDAILSGPSSPSAPPAPPAAPSPSPSPFASRLTRSIPPRLGSAPAPAGHPAPPAPTRPPISAPPAPTRPPAIQPPPPTAPPPLGRATAAPRPPASQPGQPASRPAQPAPRAPTAQPSPTAQPAQRAPATQPAQRIPAAQGNPPAPSSGLTEQRIRELHQRYLAARQSTQGTPVSLEKLAENLRATESKLRRQYQGRHVDFEIHVKDGKAVIKPKLR